VPRGVGGGGGVRGSVAVCLFVLTPLGVLCLVGAPQTGAGTWTARRHGHSQCPHHHRVLPCPLHRPRPPLSPLPVHPLRPGRKCVMYPTRVWSDPTRILSMVRLHRVLGFHKRSLAVRPCPLLEHACVPINVVSMRALGVAVALAAWVSSNSWGAGASANCSCYGSGGRCRGQAPSCPLWCSPAPWRPSING
jgi:hypothetical protein